MGGRPKKNNVGIVLVIFKRLPGFNVCESMMRTFGVIDVLFVSENYVIYLLLIDESLNLLIHNVLYVLFEFSVGVGLSINTHIYIYNYIYTHIGLLFIR